MTRAPANAEPIVSVRAIYQDLGCDHFKRHSVDQQEKRLVKRLSELAMP